MVIKEYIINTDKISIEDAIKVKKEVFLRQNPDIKNDLEVKSLISITVLNHRANKKIIQFNINE
jgi:hypothetical protein